MASHPLACPQDLFARIAELESENSKLKYRLNWKDRNTKKLTEAILRSNMWLDGLQCSCRSCRMAGYYDGDKHSDNLSEKCPLRKWLYEKVTECGMTMSFPRDAKKLAHCSDEQGKVFDIDCHLVLPDGYYGTITYGSKIWRAELGSEELKKLDSLFEALTP